MNWNPYPPTTESETVADANSSAKRISQAMLGLFVSTHIDAIGTRMEYAAVIEIVQAIATRSATQAYVDGYNRATTEVQAGKPLQKLTITTKPIDQR